MAAILSSHESVILTTVNALQKKSPRTAEKLKNIISTTCPLGRLVCANIELTFTFIKAFPSLFNLTQNPSAADSEVRLTDEPIRKAIEFYKTMIASCSDSGRIPVKRLAGHLSQATETIRNTCGRSPTNLLQFLQKYTDSFLVDATTDDVSLAYSTFRINLVDFTITSRPQGLHLEKLDGKSTSASTKPLEFTKPLHLHHTEALNVIENAILKRGALPLTNLLGYFSQAKPEIRTTIAQNVNELKTFIKQFPKVFTIKKATVHMKFLKNAHVVLVRKKPTYSLASLVEQPNEIVYIKEVTLKKKTASSPETPQVGATFIVDAVVLDPRETTLQHDPFPVWKATDLRPLDAQLKQDAADQRRPEQASQSTSKPLVISLRDWEKDIASKHCDTLSHGEGLNKEVEEESVRAVDPQHYLDKSPPSSVSLTAMSDDDFTTCISHTRTVLEAYPNSHISSLFTLLPPSTRNLVGNSIRGLEEFILTTDKVFLVDHGNISLNTLKCSNARICLTYAKRAFARLENDEEVFVHPKTIVGDIEEFEIGQNIVVDAFRIDPREVSSTSGKCSEWKATSTRFVGSPDLDGNPTLKSSSQSAQNKNVGSFTLPSVEPQVTRKTIDAHRHSGNGSPHSGMTATLEGSIQYDLPFAMLNSPSPNMYREAVVIQDQSGTRFTLSLDPSDPRTSEEATVPKEMTAAEFRLCVSQIRSLLTEHGALSVDSLLALLPEATCTLFENRSDNIWEFIVSTDNVFLADPGQHGINLNSITREICQITSKRKKYAIAKLDKRNEEVFIDSSAIVDGDGVTLEIGQKVLVNAFGHDRREVYAAAETFAKWKATRAWVGRESCETTSQSYTPEEASPANHASPRSHYLQAFKERLLQRLTEAVEEVFQGESLVSLPDAIAESLSTSFVPDKTRCISLHTRSTNTEDHIIPEQHCDHVVSSDNLSVLGRNSEALDDVLSVDNDDSEPNSRESGVQFCDRAPTSQGILNSVFDLQSELIDFNDNLTVETAVHDSGNSRGEEKTHLTGSLGHDLNDPETSPTSPTSNTPDVSKLLPLCSDMWVSKSDSDNSDTAKDKVLFHAENSCEMSLSSLNGYDVDIVSSEASDCFSTCIESFSSCEYNTDDNCSELDGNAEDTLVLQSVLGVNRDGVLPFSLKGGKSDESELLIGNSCYGSVPSSSDYASNVMTLNVEGDVVWSVPATGGVEPSCDQIPPSAGTIEHHNALDIGQLSCHNVSNIEGNICHNTVTAGDMCSTDSPDAGEMTHDASYNDSDIVNESPLISGNTELSANENPGEDTEVTQKTDGSDLASNQMTWNVEGEVVWSVPVTGGVEPNCDVAADVAAISDPENDICDASSDDVSHNATATQNATGNNINHTVSLVGVNICHTSATLGDMHSPDSPDAGEMTCDAGTSLNNITSYNDPSLLISGNSELNANENPGEDTEVTQEIDGSQPSSSDLASNHMTLNVEGEVVWSVPVTGGVEPSCDVSADVSVISDPEKNIGNASSDDASHNATDVSDACITGVGNNHAQTAPSAGTIEHHNAPDFGQLSCHNVSNIVGNICHNTVTAGDMCSTDSPEAGEMIRDASYNDHDIVKETQVISGNTEPSANENPAEDAQVTNKKKKRKPKKKKTLVEEVKSGDDSLSCTNNTSDKPQNEPVGETQNATGQNNKCNGQPILKNVHSQTNITGHVIGTAWYK